MRRSRSRSRSPSDSNIRRSRLKKSASKRRLKHNPEAAAKVKADAIQRTSLCNFRHSEPTVAGLGIIRGLELSKREARTRPPVQHVCEVRKIPKVNPVED